MGYVDMWKLLALAGVASVVAGCAQTPGGTAASGVAEDETPSISAMAETAPTRQDGANMAVVALDPHDPSQSVILGTGELGGLDIYALSGERIGEVDVGEIESVDIRYNVALGGSSVTLVSVLDSKSNQVRFFSYDFASRTLTDVSSKSIGLDFAAVGVCLVRNPRDGNLYSFITGDGGEIEQWLLSDNQAGGIEGKLSRRLNLASEAGYCAGNDASGDFYVSEEAVGIWRFAADPEAEAIPEIIDVVKFGTVDEEVKGISVIPNGKGKGFLVASNASSNTFNLYDIQNDHTLAGRFSVSGAGPVDAIEEGGGVYALNFPLGSRYPNGVAVIADDDNEDDATNYKLVSLGSIADAAGVNFGDAADPRVIPPSPIATVQPSFETSSVTSAGDAADDPAIWVHPSNPELSTIIGTEKQSGLYVYNLNGEVIQYLPDGKLNNVDIRYGFPLSGENVAIVTASNRTNDSIAIYAVEPATRMLRNVADGVIDAILADPYGLCMYRSPSSDDYYVFINDTDGNVKQWRLSDTGQGRVGAELVREFALDSQTEGCVADDETGDLFIGEEEVGIWKFGAEPSAGDAKIPVAMADDYDALTVDVEGLSIYYGEYGGGYLVASSQGSDSFALFRREAPHEFVGAFAVVANGAKGIDGVSETDGLDVSSVPLGPEYPKGVFVAQDGRNILPPENQNFKVVSWEEIATRLQLD